MRLTVRQRSWYVPPDIGQSHDRDPGVVTRGRDLNQHFSGMEFFHKPTSLGMPVHKPNCSIGLRHDGVGREGPGDSGGDVWLWDGRGVE